MKVPGKKTSKSKEKIKLTRKEAGFVADVAKGKSGTQAVKDNYDTKNDNSAAVIAHQNLRKPKIQQALADAFPDELLQEVHLELLRAGSLQEMVFPLEYQKVKVDIKKKGALDDDEDPDLVVDKYTWEKADLSDDDIKEMFKMSGCIVKRIVKTYSNRRVYFWGPDHIVRDRALDKAYKIKGGYAAEKREIAGLNGEPLFSNEHKDKSDKALDEYLGK